MSDTSRHLVPLCASAPATHRSPTSRRAAPAPFPMMMVVAPPSPSSSSVRASSASMGLAGPTTSAARVDALRKLVDAGQYQVNARWLARKICGAAGLSLAE